MASTLFPFSNKLSAPRFSATSANAKQKSSFYQVLGVQTGATHQEIKSAYRKLARVLHPDVARDATSAADEFMRVHEAYTTLSDPEKRAMYDKSLLHHRQMRTWETDQCW